MTEFPHLNTDYLQPTSPATPFYNCIAWAAGDTTRWWWPTPGVYYWPPRAPLEETIGAFVAAFAMLGYAPCQNGNLEPGVEKLAIYATGGGVPTHMARQLPNGHWTSKVGSDIDVEHGTLQQFTGGVYGVVVQFLCR